MILRHLGRFVDARLAVDFRPLQLYHFDATRL